MGIACGRRRDSDGRGMLSELADRALGEMLPVSCIDQWRVKLGIFR